MARWVKNLSTMHEMWETWVQSLGWENPRVGNGTPSSILAWKIPWAEEPGGLQSTGSQSHTRLSMSAVYVNIELLLYT